MPGCDGALYCKYNKMHEQEKIPAIKIFYPPTPFKGCVFTKSLPCVSSPRSWGVRMKDTGRFHAKTRPKTAERCSQAMQIKKIINITGPKTMWEIV